ncbi:MAG TPA: hypothetical protein VE860_13770, partial [Chthoniobacterales bacterium]|nr:hypothetical protein [Chthoniobacterales bacterium]
MDSLGAHSTGAPYIKIDPESSPKPAGAVTGPLAHARSIQTMKIDGKPCRTIWLNDDGTSVSV